METEDEKARRLLIEEAKKGNEFNVVGMDATQIIDMIYTFREKSEAHTDSVRLKMNTEHRKLIIKALETYLDKDKEILALYEKWFKQKGYDNPDLKFDEAECLEKIIELKACVQRGEERITDLRSHPI